MKREAYLMLTEFCPNRCDYCYIKAKDSRAAMSMATVDAIMAEHKPWRVVFFGGEPLVELDLMEEILAKYHGRCRFQLVTSAMVNYERFISKVHRRYPLDEIQVSWDGVGNASRLSADGVNRQDEVYRKILWTAAQGVGIDVKCVLNNLNIYSMYDTYREFRRLESLGIRGEFVVAHREEISEDFFREFERQLPLCLDPAGRISVEFLNRILNVIQRSRTVASCDAGQYLVFRPDGGLSHCTILSQYYPRAFSAGELVAPCTHPDCAACELAILCDGGCRYERVAVYGEGWRENYCPHTCRLNRIYHRVIRGWQDGMPPAVRLGFNQTLLRYLDFMKTYKGMGL
ncbi:MAG: radical SAM protein [Negativicutes bacterium]|nr:radical SAM protein [Negativicutes bacterium]